MTRRVRSRDLETRSAGLRLARRKKPYAAKIMRDVSLLCRRNETAGPWMVRVCRDGADWTERTRVPIGPNWLHEVKYDSYRMMR
jgi:hypothetical protein